MKKNQSKLKEVSNEAKLNEYRIWRGNQKSAVFVGVVKATDLAAAQKRAERKWPEYEFDIPDPKPGHINRRMFVEVEGSLPTTEVKESFTDQWDRRFAEGLKRDAEWLEKLNESKRLGKDEAMKTKTEGKTKSKDAAKEKTKAAPPKKEARQNWNEHGMCEIIRYCGKKGFGKEKTAKIVESMNFEANPATINIQLRKGRLGEGVPELSKEHRAEFNAIADDIPNDAPKKKADKKASKKDDAKAEKGDKKSAKASSGKKMKKHSSSEESEAEAAAEADAAEDEDVEVEDEVEEEVEA